MPSADPANSGGRKARAALWRYFLIFAVTLVAYIPVFSAGFIWDDTPGHVTNPELRSVAGLGRIWFEVGATQQYYPLLHSAFWLEHRLWGNSPFGYHLVNVLLHACAACLFGHVLHRLRVAGGWFAALLFALHPVCVESVAWISEQKNTLSTVLYLSAALAYLRFDHKRRLRPYAIATTLFALALLTKTVTATLPAALLVVFWWQRGGIGWRRDFRPLVPWFALSVAAGTGTAWIERGQVGAQGDEFALGIVERGLLAGRALWFYLGKIVWPADLIFIYPRWTLDLAILWQWLFPSSAAAVIAGLWYRRRRNPGIFAGALLFTGSLFPALGFVNVFPFIYSFVADHFQYLALPAILALTGAGAHRLATRVPRTIAGAAGMLVITALAALTWRQSATYRDIFTLYTTTLARNPGAWMAHNNLAIALVDAGRAAEALPHYQAALALRPRYAEAENNLGYALTHLGRPAEALPHLQRAIQLRPGYAEAHNNLGAAFMALGRVDEGVAAFKEATRRNPRYAVAHFNLGLALASHGSPADGIPHFERAVQLHSAYADAELNWAVALALTGRVNAALPHFERALQLNPNVAHAHLNYGRALASVGRLDEAIARFRAGLELQPNSVEAHRQLAIALRQLGRTDEAGQHLRAAESAGAR